ncbi:uncharacterized protein AB675_828 [Cyphellophora attinorum]|uniref:Uncharacterized protein n=1 Tax=Cyphellophora attinorum TaxID=1664694 RepID=A0A0N0NS48_9EURO|nr:uncharacterized protein AB675_828 [Phialophora attinorum]KPI45841.1 hypothetical protein AB675_828 [Phialophora attinorum]
MAEATTVNWEDDEFSQYIKTCEPKYLLNEAHAYEDSKYRLRGKFAFGIEAGVCSLGWGTPFTLIYSGWAWKNFRKVDRRFDIMVHTMKKRDLTWVGCSEAHKWKMWAAGQVKP